MNMRLSPNFSGTYTPVLQGVTVTQRTWRKAWLGSKPCSPAELIRLQHNTTQAVDRIERKLGVPVSLTMTTERLDGQLQTGPTPVVFMEFKAGSQSGRVRVLEGSRISLRDYKRALKNALTFIETLPQRPKR